MISVSAMWPLFLESELDETDVDSWSDGSVDIMFSFEGGQKVKINMTKEFVERIYIASQEAQQ